jgi:hypothetical protein
MKTPDHPMLDRALTLPMDVFSPDGRVPATPGSAGEARLQSRQTEDRMNRIYRMVWILSWIGDGDAPLKVNP